VRSSTIVVLLPVLGSRHAEPPVRYFNNGITIPIMVRLPLTPQQRDYGLRLGRTLRTARADRSLAEVATAAGISAETLRKIETGRIATPSFPMIAALAVVLDLSLDALAADTSRDVVEPDIRTA
jgi:DNA-binding XRE family transcriptional regulator